MNFGGHPKKENTARVLRPVQKQAEQRQKIMGAANLIHEDLSKRYVCILKSEKQWFIMVFVLRKIKIKNCKTKNCKTKNVLKQGCNLVLFC
jgi:hypothetical protein